MQDIINEFAEKVIHGLNDYITEHLGALGYSREYVREHKYDFITVHINPELAGDQMLSFVVHVPDEWILFGVRRRFELKDSVTEDGSVVRRHIIVYESVDASEATDEMVVHILACAARAREKALEALK